MNTYNSYDEAVAAGAKGTDRVREICGNCDGGHKSWFAHVLNGVCFQCNGSGFHSVQVNTIKDRERRHQKLLAEQEARNLEEAAKVAARVNWNVENSETLAMIKALADSGLEFAADVLDTPRVPTDNQIAALQKIADERANREANEIDVPEGRQEVTGRVVSYKMVADNYSYHGGEITKILVEDERGFRVFGTAPASLLDAAFSAFEASIKEDGAYRGDFGPEYYLEHFLKGQQVTFTATLEGKEKGFGFFKRPTKAALKN